MAFRGVLLALLLSVAVSAQTPPPDVEALLANMNLRQKVGQMFMVTFYGPAPNEAARQLLTAWQPGAAALLPSNLGDPTQVARITNAIQTLVTESGGPPMFIAVDQEGGLISRLKDGFTAWPAPALWTATNNPDLIYQVGRAMAREMLAVGVNMNLAPVADVNTNPANPIIGRRAFGSDAAMVAMAVSAWIRGAQEAGVMAVAKHFPGHGDTSADSHVELPTVPHDMERLASVELLPFAASIRDGVGAIMMGHLYMAALESQPAVPASLSPVVVQRLLREGLGYNGIVMTDAMDMDAIDTIYGPAERALKALEAGNDLILLGAHISPEAQMAAMEALVTAVETGAVPEERIDASVRRILLAKARFGVLSWQPVDANEAAARIDLETGSQLIEELFRQGTTMVKDDFGALPLPPGALMIYPAFRPSLWNDCKPPGVTPLGVSGSPTDDEIAWARSAARDATAVVVFTQNAISDSQQARLVQALPQEKTLVIALHDVNDLLMFPEVGAYAVTYSPHLGSTRALCDLLTGNTQIRGVFSLQIGR
jgi:beta-N-acetylhexosaminidase